MTLLAQDDVTLTIGGVSVTMKPTLRAAMRIERRFDGFERLFEDLEAFSLSTTAALITEAATTEREAAAFLAHLASKPVGVTLTDLQPALVAFALQLAGLSLDAPEEKGAASTKSTASRTTWREHHEALYRIGTGWLQWTPETVWRATPAEITFAYRGLIEKLKAIHGAPEKPNDERSLAEKWRDLLAARMPQAEAA